MRRGHPVGAAITRELSEWRLWWARAVVMAAAALAGLTVVAFSWAGERAFGLFAAVSAAAWWSPLLWTPLCTGAIVWATRRYAPGAAGSGIPQVMAALESGVAPDRHALFVSLRLSAAKIALTTWGLLAGLSLGREGPSVQVAAGVMLAAQRWLPRRSGVTAHGLLVAGGAAGIAAAFNTPLAGVMFAIEELSRTPEQRNSGLLLTAIVLAGVIAVAANGNATYFGIIHASAVGLGMLLPALLVTLASGLAGGLFARLLINSLNPQSGEASGMLRRRYPVRFAIACGLAVAVIGVLTDGATFGSGYSHTRATLAGADDLPAIYLLLKVIATWLTTWSGVPAGIFAPALAIGAGLGDELSRLSQYPHAPALIALGMVGFLAAVTQAPLTAFIIVMEMVDGHTMVLSLMAGALVASGVSRLLSRPLYATLSQMQLLRLPAEPAPVSAPAR
ncbi:MAG: chloride channel protein [Pseudomonadota bacterium]|nr:chloride channel protein [Pseudomonadota bacterium]